MVLVPGVRSPWKSIADDVRGVKWPSTGRVEHEIPDGHEQRPDHAGDDALSNDGMFLSVQDGPKVRIQQRRCRRSTLGQVLSKCCVGGHWRAPRAKLTANSYQLQPAATGKG
jgi:hypothetical protein